MRARNGVYLASLDGKEPRLLIGEAERAVYSASGHLLFVRGGTLVAQSFDVTSMQITGEAFPIPGPDGEVIATATSFFSVSPNGVLGVRQNPTARPFNSIGTTDRGGYWSR